MREFIYKDMKFEYIPYSEFTEDLLPELLPYKKSGFVNAGAAFDIETTSYLSEKYKKAMATMWNWQFGLDDLTITGRTWEEFKEFIEALNAHVPDGQILLVWIQNLSFEFQFIKGLFDWNIDRNGKYEIFAKTDRDIIYAKYKKIEFRDSLALTGLPLRSYQKNFKTKVGKMNGDLDYRIMRHSGSEITEPEMAYNINDVQVLTSFFHTYIKPFFLDQDINIPLTSTGVVREEMKRNFLSLPKEFKKAYRKIIKYAMPSRELYLVIRQFGFRGGLVHANTSACNECIPDNASEKDLPISKDLKSAHPSHELNDKLHMRYRRRNKKYWQHIIKDVLENVDDKGFFGCFTFRKIRAAGWHCIESKNKLVEYSSDAIFENGRLASASYIKVCLMELDFLNYLDMYQWEIMDCEYIYTTTKEYLPDFMRKTICHYFFEKENQPKDSLEYNAAKRKLNSTFGFCATGLVEQELQYNPFRKQFEEFPEIRTYESLTKNLLLLPQWAMCIAAGTRRDICRALKATGCDSLYYDTDSDKVRHPEKYEEWFDHFNNEKMEKNKKMNTFGYDPKIFERIGCFEDEYRMTKFKVLGAKRYLVEHDGETVVTVAGMKKGSLEKYCEEENKNIWDLFSVKGLELPRDRSGKTTTIYTDEAIDDYLIDYNGEGREVHEESCVAIIDIPFKMNISMEFIEQIIQKKKERRNQIYKGVL